MVKKKVKEMEEVVEVSAEEAVIPKKKGSRSIIVELPDGTTMSRKDYCIKRANEGAKRSEIAKELSTLLGKDVPFQIVFAATAHMNNVYAKRDKEATAKVKTKANATVESIEVEAA